MKGRMAALFLAFALLTGGAAPAASAAAWEQDRLSAYANGQVLVRYVDGGMQVLTYEDIPALKRGLAQLEQDETVLYVQPNYTYETTALSTSDPYGVVQWALENDGSFEMTQERRPSVRENPFVPERWRMRTLAGTDSGEPLQARVGVDINAQSAWSVYGGGSRQVVIALIDTGVDTGHEDLQNILWVNEDEIPGNGVDDDGNGYVDDVNGWNFYDNTAQIHSAREQDSHATHGAGTIAATADNGIGIAGIVNSETVKIMVIKALGGESGTGSTQSLIRAIEYARDNGASICNLSLGSSEQDMAMYQTMASSGMLFVAAAGNDGVDTDRQPCYPAAYDLDNIISVANISYDGNLHSSSSYGGKTVDLAAPGTYIFSTLPGNQYGYMTGTSMAAPMVTAAAAMLYSHYSTITLADVKDILLETVQPVDSLAGRTLTGGMLNLGAAMTAGASRTTGREWDVVHHAPQIRVQSVWLGIASGIVVQITDADGDLKLTSYRVGEWSEQDFTGGEKGTVFELDALGKLTFSVTGSGAITFFALDEQGNASVHIVRIGTQWAGMPPTNGTPMQPPYRGSWRYYDHMAGGRW